MMRWIVLAVLVVALSAAATVIVQVVPLSGSDSPRGVPFPAPEPGKRPLATVDQDLKYNFGTMRHKDKGHRKWTFRNKGEGDLLLTMVSSTCKCTVASLKDGKTATLKPGESTEVELEWETKTIGDFGQSATIGTNDPEHPTFDLAVQGTVRPAVMVYPSDDTINFLEITNDAEDHRGRAGVYTADTDDFEVTGMESSKPGVILVEKEPMPEDEIKQFKAKKGYRLTIDVKSGMPLGAFREEVVVKTNHPMQPEVRLMVIGTMLGPITVRPDRLRLTPPNDVSSRRGGRADLKLFVRGQRDTTFRVEKAPEKVKVNIERAETLEHVTVYSMVVTFLPGMAAGPIEDEIVLKTDHPKAAELKIPITVFVHEDN